MQNIDTIGYSLVFTLPALAVILGLLSLLIPRRRTVARHSESPRQAA